MAKQKKWVLIWWIDSHHKNVIEPNKIKKSDQQVDCIIILKWVDEKKNTLAKARIVAIGGTYMQYD